MIQIPENIMKNVYIHIGMPKTGSTSIQCFCKENIGKLKSQGIHYPLPYNGGENHVDITSAYFNHFHMKHEGIFSIRRKDFELSHCHSAVFSSEFCIVDDINYYEKLVENYNHKYIVYLRSPILFAESEAYSNSFFYTLDYFNVNECWFKIFPHQYTFDFSRQIDLLTNFSKNNYKNEHFILKSFDKIKKGSDLLIDFCQTIGVEDYSKLQFIAPKNVSLKTDYAFFLAHTNMIPLSYEQRCCLANELSILSAQDDKAKKYRLIPDETIKAIPSDIIQQYDEIGAYIGDRDFWHRGYDKAMRREVIPYKQLPYDK